MFKFKNIINSQSRTITSAAIIIGALSLVSRLLGVFRDRILASHFGAGDTLDIYYAAFRLPDLVYNLVVLGAISAGLIPVFTSLLEEASPLNRKKQEAWRLINSVLNFIIIGLLLICGLFFVFAEQIIPLITPGFS
ncbi:MAG TPA: lipid II flippase MurJ, partial [bacterium]|nr:lipid II flippase MurJ [bacterium]HOH67253.1 lipid II flippase MurJ [bacterium]